LEIVHERLGRALAGRVSSAPEIVLNDTTFGADTDRTSILSVARRQRFNDRQGGDPSGRNPAGGEGDVSRHCHDDSDDYSKLSDSHRLIAQWADKLP
jgi:hypothetical protein